MYKLKREEIQLRQLDEQNKIKDYENKELQGARIRG